MSIPLLPNLSGGFASPVAVPPVGVHSVVSPPAVNVMPMPPMSPVAYSPRLVMPYMTTPTSVVRHPSAVMPPVYVRGAPRQPIVLRNPPVDGGHLSVHGGLVHSGFTSAVNSAANLATVGNGRLTPAGSVMLTPAVSSKVIGTPVPVTPIVSAFGTPVAAMPTSITATPVATVPAASQVVTPVVAPIWPSIQTTVSSAGFAGTPAAMAVPAQRPIPLSTPAVTVLASSRSIPVLSRVATPAAFTPVVRPGIAMTMPRSGGMVIPGQMMRSVPSLFVRPATVAPRVVMSGLSGTSIMQPSFSMATSVPPGVCVRQPAILPASAVGAFTNAPLVPRVFL